jgi:hypothetical protein
MRTDTSSTGTRNTHAGNTDTVSTDTAAGFKLLLTPIEQSAVAVADAASGGRQTRLRTAYAAGLSTSLGLDEGHAGGCG